MSYKRVVFVCTGNTCRSPMAMALLRSMPEMDDIEILSRGLVVLFSEPANPKACDVCINHNLNLEDHRTLPLKNTDITEDTLVLTMTESQKDIVSSRFGEGTHVFALKEYVGEQGDVSDPYGGPITVYEDCFVELSRLVKKLTYKLGPGAV
ncbi:MAG: low molecular weight protein arginine phosphatase [Lachnospiraceae bacterium]|nr:low molecular weight protein arginine phosphatase [Lachnospiraceae bacterium]